MKILIITRDTGEGGGGQAIINRISEIKKLNRMVNIKIISPKNIADLKENVSFELINIPGKLFFIKDLFFITKANIIIKKELMRENYDLIICNHPFLIFKPKINVISIFHGLHNSFYKNLPKNMIISNLARIFHKIYSPIDRLQIKYSDKVYFVSKSTMEEAKEFYPEYKYKFYYKSNKIDKTIFFKLNNEDKIKVKKELKLNDGKKNILFVGRLEQLKGILNLVKIIRGINNPNIRLLVIGDGPLKNKIQKYSFVKYIGRIPNKYLYKYYNAVDLFILPSYYENSPLTILEAKACGCKILASDVGDNKYNLNKKSIYHSKDELVRGLK